jgi:hypothetical protein
MMVELIDDFFAVHPTVSSASDNRNCSTPSPRRSRAKLAAKTARQQLIEMHVNAEFRREDVGASISYERHRPQLTPR